MAKKRMGRPTRYAGEKRLPVTVSLTVTAIRKLSSAMRTKRVTASAVVEELLRQK